MTVDTKVIADSIVDLTQDIMLELLEDEELNLPSINEKDLGDQIDYIVLQNIKNKEV